MSSNDTNSTTPKHAPRKGSKEYRELARKRQQQQQQIILAIVAIVLLIGVVGVIFLSTRPPEANIPDGTTTRYKELADMGLMGKTADGNPYLGKADAPVLLEEISSFACPFCKQYHDTTVVNILDLIKDGKAKFVYIPIASTGEFPPTVATYASFCAQEQGKFWEMHDVLFDWQTRYAAASNDLPRLQAAATALGMDAGKLADCMNRKDIKDQLDKNEQIAKQRGLTGTPTIYLDGKQIQPALGDAKEPSFGELRGLIETLSGQKK